MGADGGVTIFNRRGIEEYLSDASNRQNMIDDFKETSSWRKNGNYTEQLLEILNSHEEFSGSVYLALIKSICGSPWMNFDDINVAGAACTIVTISYGTNVPTLVGDIETYFESVCPEHIIWTGGTWT